MADTQQKQDQQQRRDERAQQRQQPEDRPPQGDAANARRPKLPQAGEAGTFQQE